jgi:hypothetical protein
VCATRRVYTERLGRSASVLASNAELHKKKKPELPQAVLQSYVVYVGEICLRIGWDFKLFTVGLLLLYCAWFGYKFSQIPVVKTAPRREDVWKSGDSSAHY